MSLGPALLSGQTVRNGAPPDAIVLWDGGALCRFVSANGEPLNWKRVDEKLISTPNGRRSNNAISDVMFEDAEIHLEFQLPKSGSGNSGVFIHGVYELQILGSEGKDSVEASDMGGLYSIAAPLCNAAAPREEWQAYDIRFVAPRRDAQGSLIKAGAMTVRLNGVLIHQATPLGDRESRYNPYRYDATEYMRELERRQLATGEGSLMLQDHDEPIAFRNIWLRRIPAGDATVEP
ncbi:MAG: DUF1080 domain-containing protein [Planctomycetales bacterium]|nr:DUF1080 domain-containing protein [Planctomycetales bacterium]